MNTSITANINMHSKMMHEWFKLFLHILLYIIIQMQEVNQANLKHVLGTHPRGFLYEQ